MPMCERLFEADVLRNAALAEAESYDAFSKKNAEFEVLNKAKAVRNTTPLFSDLLAGKFACKQQEVCRKACLDSMI